MSSSFRSASTTALLTASLFVVSTYLVSARAAASLGSLLAGTSVARRAFAHQFALGFRASNRLLAFPVAFSRFAHRSADGVGGLALSAAVGGGADSLALGAILLLAQILRATHVALRLVAVNLALGALSLMRGRTVEGEQREKG
jgi:hypothetical protein